MSGSDQAILSVCVVEDEKRLRDLLVREVAAMGHCSTGYSTAEEAWEHISAGADVVLLDLNLPGMSGMELLARIRTQHLDVAVVILTGFGGFESAVQSLRWKVEDYLTKPCSLADIDRVLANVLARKRESQRVQAVERTARLETTAPRQRSEVPSAMAAPQTVEELEREHILAVLAAHHNDKRSAAEALGISLRTLYYKLNAYRHQGFIN